MTEQQKKALGEIRRYASNILGQEKHWKRVNLQAYAIMHLSANRVIELVRAIEADGKCKIEPPDVDIDFYHCSRCACKISGGFREGAFGDGEEWWNDPYCPGCGREIEAAE